MEGTTKDSILFLIEIIKIKKITPDNFENVVKSAYHNLVGTFVILIIAVVGFIVTTILDSNNLKVTSIIIIGFILLSLFIGTWVLLSKLNNLIIFKQAKCSTFIECEGKIRELLFSDRHKDVETLLYNKIKEHKKHQDFVDEFKEITRREPDRLSTISETAKHSIGGRYQCVLANIKYFEDRPDGKFSQVNGLINYFLSFNNLTQHNQFIRIFSLPSKGNATERKANLDEEQAIILLHYILANFMVGIETYVLMFNDERNDYKFFKTLDYVIGENYINGQKETKLYFSYETAMMKGDYVMCSTDNFLINMMQQDFNERRKTIGVDENELTCIKISDRNEYFYKLLRVLGIFNEKNEEIKPGIEKEILDSFLNRISIDDVCPDKDLLDSITRQINSWIAIIKRKYKTKK